MTVSVAAGNIVARGPGAGLAFARVAVIAAGRTPTLVGRPVRAGVERPRPRDLVCPDLSRLSLRCVLPCMRVPRSTIDRFYPVRYMSVDMYQVIN